MKSLLLFLLFFPFLLFGQSSYDRGFQEGFKNGYCYQNPNCLSPIPPITPIPTLNEDPNSYQDGYNRGFEIGYSRRGTNTGNGYSQSRIVPPAQYVQPIPTDILIAGAQYQAQVNQQRIDIILKLNSQIIEGYQYLSPCSQKQVDIIEESRQEAMQNALQSNRPDLHALIERLRELRDFTTERIKIMCH